MPEEESLRSKARHTAVLFARPSNDVVIECLDGSGNYPPITALGYVEERFAATFY